MVVRTFKLPSVSTLTITMKHTPDTLADKLLETNGMIFGKEFSEIEGMQQGRGPRTLRRDAAFKIGDQLKYKSPNLWHPRHLMTVIGVNPLRVKYASGKEGSESESNVMLAD